MTIEYKNSYHMTAQTNSSLVSVPLVCHIQYYGLY